MTIDSEKRWAEWVAQFPSITEISQAEYEAKRRELFPEEFEPKPEAPPPEPEPPEIEPEVEPVIEITGVDETKLGPGAIAGKEVDEKVHPEFVALVESGAPAIEIWEAAQGVSGSYAYGIREQLASQFEVASKLEGEARVEASRALGVLPEGFDELPQELKDAYAEGDKAFRVAVEAYNKDIEARRQARYEAAHALDVVRTPEGGYDLQKAFAMGLGALVYEAKAAGLFTEEQIVAAQFGGIEVRGRERAMAEIEKIAPDAVTVDEEGRASISLETALLAGVSEATLRSAGVDHKRVKEAARFASETKGTLEALSGYQTDEGLYELDRAFTEEKGGLVYDALKIGLFTPEQVMEAHFGSIEGQSLKRAFETLEGYRNPDGTYDLSRAYEGKVSTSAIALMFGKDVADRYRAGDFKLLPTLLPPAVGTLAEYWPEGAPVNIPEGFLSDDEYRAMMQRREHSEWLEAYNKGDPRAHMNVLTWGQTITSLQTIQRTTAEFAWMEVPEIFALDPVYKDIKARLDAVKAEDLPRGLISPTQERAQEEMDAYMERWKRSMIQKGIAIVTLPALITPMPFIGVAATAAFRGIPYLPKIASALATLIIRATPTVYTSATIAEGAKFDNLERKWKLFESLPKGEKDFWAKQAGYAKWEGLSEIEQAYTLLRYSAPPGVTLAEWGKTLSDVHDKAQEYVYKGVDWVREKVPSPISEPVAFLGGTVVGALVAAPTYMAMIPVLSAQLIDEVPKGTADEYAAAVAVGMGAFLVSYVNLMKADPTRTIGWTIGLMIGPGGMYKLAQGVGARLHPKYVPERGMATEWSVVRMPLDPLSPKARVEWVAACNKIWQGLLSGKKKVTAKWADGTITGTWKGTAYQEVRPNTFFSGITDITKFDPTNPGKQILWGSPQLARRFAELSASGVPAKHPGVIEVYLGPTGLKQWSANILSAATLSEMRRLAEEAFARGVPPGAYPPFKEYMGAIELEMTTVGPYEAVPGWGGKGVSANVVFGSYPVHRYILKGLGFSSELLPLEKVLRYETRYPLDLLKKAEPNYIAELIAEIKSNGITEPVTIRIREDGSRIVWDGMHRLIAAKDLGIKNIPVRYIGEGAVGLRYRGLSFTQAMTVRARANVEAVLDFFLDYELRMKTLKRMWRAGEEAETPELRAYIKNEGALANMAELIHGRRKAFELEVTPELSEKALREVIEKYYKDDPAMAKLLLDIGRGIVDEAALMKHPKVKEMTQALIRTEGQMAENILRETLGKYASLFDEYAEYYRYPGDYGRAYIDSYSKFLMVALARGEREAREVREALPRELVRPERYPREAIPTERRYVPPTLAEIRVPPREEERIIPLEEERIIPPEEERPPIEEEERPPIEEERPPEEEEERPPEEEEPPPPPPPIIIPVPSLEVPVSQLIEPGSIAWKQGLFWKYIPPPYDQKKPITMPRRVAPMGAVNTHLRTPAETIQMIGRSRATVPQNVDIDLGVVDIFITDAGQNIEFRGKGELTDVGSRLPSPTVGMDLGEGGEDLFGVSEAEAMGDRPKRKKAKKVKRANRHYTPPTTLAGMRF